METKSRSRQRSFMAAAAVAVVAAAFTSGCNSNPSSGSPAYKPGELGNGGFLFACDDSVACDRWTTNNAKDFPDIIATGAVFDVRFVASGQQGTTVTINNQRYDGVTTQPVAPYVSSGPDGFTTVKPGYGMFVVKDSRGFIIDYATVKIVKPDDLVVYESKYKGGSDPPQLQAVTLKASETQSFRTVAALKTYGPIAGSVRVQWESADTNIVQVQSYTRGVVTVVAKGVGKTTLKAIGASLEKQIEVEVTQ